MDGSLAERHAATVTGSGPHTLVLLHGFGTDQTVWDPLIAALATPLRILRYDHMGAGRSRQQAYDPQRYATLEGYASDLAALLEDLDLRDVTVVGHSVSGMIALLAQRRSARIARLVMIASSPRYLNDADYVGGFERQDVESLLAQMELDFLGWARTLAPAAMANPDRPDLAEDLTYSFSAANPERLRRFARATFLTDLRAELSACEAPTLVLQPAEDVIVPRQTAEFLAAQLPDARLEILPAQGHYPHVSAPAVVAAAILRFLGDVGTGAT